MPGLVFRDLLSVLRQRPSIPALMCMLVATVVFRQLLQVVIYFGPQQHAGNILALAAGLMVAAWMALLLMAMRAASTEPVKALHAE